MMTTLRKTLELLIRTHPYNTSSQTCGCNPNPPAITVEQHSAHVVHRILLQLNGKDTP